MEIRVFIMTKFKYPILTLFLLAFLANSCKKAKNVDGTVLITVTYLNKAQPNITIYMKKGTLINPQIPIGSYDQNQTTAANGQAYFEGLPEDKFYFYVKTKIGNDSLWGQTSTTVVYKPSPNVYDLKIGLNP